MSTVLSTSERVASLAGRLIRTRHEIRRVLLRHGLAVLAMLVLVGVFFACGIDWLFHVSPGMRVLFLVALGAMAAWTVFRWLVVPLSVSISDLQLALRVERLHPEFEESLSSSIALAAHEEDVRSGSRRLRQAVLEQAAQRAEPIRFDEVIDHGPSRRALIRAGIVAVAALVVGLAFPQTAKTALARLAQPFGGVEWPKRTQIVRMDHPVKMAKGDPFQLRLEVKGVVPDRMTIEYRFADGQQAPPIYLMPEGTPADGTQTASAPPSISFATTLEAASQPFEFLVQGGDADTGWVAVDVVPAPDVTALQVTVTPPAYTGLEPVALPEGRGHIKGVVGSLVKVEAKSNKPIRGGRLTWEKGLASEKSTLGTVSTDQTSLSASFTITQSDTYQIVLEDEQGMTNEHRSPRPYRIEAIADAPPEVKIDQPGGDMEVTRQAKIPIRWQVRDDFGIQSVERVFNIDRPGEKKPTEEVKEGSPSPATKETIYAGNDRPTQRSIEDDWDLAPLELPIGSVVTFRGSAKDYRTPPEPNVGDSRSVRLLIVSQADFVRQIDAEQKLIREEIQRLRKLEETALRQTSDLAEQSQATGKLDQADREKLQTVEMTQRRIREKTAGDESSLQSQIRSLSDKLSANRVDDLDTSKRLALMESELGRIQDQHLSTIESKLTSARKGLPDAKSSEGTRPPGESPPQPEGEKSPVAQDLTEAKEHQEEVVQSLDAMLDQLDRWESVADVVNEARDVERRQAEVAKKVAELAAKTLGKAEADLTGEEKGALAQAGAQQEEVRQELNRLERKITRQAEKTSADDPVASEAMKEAAEKSRQANIGGKMSDAANKIRGNQLSEAGSDQQQAAEGLRSMVESLENRREQDLKRLVKNLKQAEEDLSAIREEQKKLRKETEEAASLADAQKREAELRRLEQRQQELQKKSEEFARRLSQLQAKGASQSAGRASSRMSNATDAMKQGQGENAGEQQDQAEEQLQDAAEQLAETREQAEEQLAQEQLAKVADSIKQIHQRQLSLKDEVVRLDGVRQKEGKLTRGQLQSLLGLSRAEKGLAEESAALKERLSEAKVFHLVIEEATDLMNRGSEKLASKETGAEAQKPLDRAGQKFAQLIDSLRKDPNQKKPKKNGQQQGGEGEGQGGSGEDGIPSVAQLKLLRVIQQELLQDTKSLADLKAEEASQRAEEYAALSKRQGKLADLVRDLMKPKGDEEAPGGEETP